MTRLGKVVFEKVPGGDLPFRSAFAVPDSAPDLELELEFAALELAALGM